MMKENCLTLSGIVYKQPIIKVSPSGIFHYHFILDHCSIQREAGFYRKAWCRLSVIISGKESLKITSNIINKAKITVRGFISCHQGRNGLNKIVLHAKTVDSIYSGD
ncbi:primosomal replication protein N [secondary endosymbiont of Heteropsylla cubana]|uniref:Primosomal replication protein N n=1 Tax=secondary endosymbiont of Heteropsylla cubana TaxID=134287 RepID=J3Z561_9ENTR|nr:primosomal replication protein N [secondary endosymbiont of Heteropsylla cubana]AFP85444.1 primosomal replication protein N [secondary endosymbiont of Heteropsylla cubana]